MDDRNSLRNVFQRYLESEKLQNPVRSIVELIASGELTRTNFDDLIKTEELCDAPSLKETLLDITLVFTHECVEDHYLSEIEMDELDYLITIFRIEEGDFYKLRRDAVQEVINAQTTWILQDKYVSDHEEILQRDLRQIFGLSYDQYVTLLRPLAEKNIEELESKKLATRDHEELKLIDASIQNLRGVFLVGKNETDRIQIYF